MADRLAELLLARLGAGTHNSRPGPGGQACRCAAPEETLLGVFRPILFSMA